MRVLGSLSNLYRHWFSPKGVRKGGPHGLGASQELGHRKEGGNKVRSIVLKSGWWLIGELERRAVAKRLRGTDVVGYVVRGNDTKWKNLEGRNDEFDSATLAADALVEDLRAHPV